MNTSRLTTGTDYVRAWTAISEQMTPATESAVYAAVREANRLADDAGRDHDDSLNPTWCEDAVTAYQATRPAPATEPVTIVTADPEPQGYAIPSPEETAAHRAEQGDQSWSTSGVTADDMVPVMDVRVGDTILSPAHHHPVGPRVVRAIEETGLGRTLRFTNKTIAGFYRSHHVTMIARAPETAEDADHGTADLENRVLALYAAGQLRYDPVADDWYLDGTAVDDVTGFTIERLNREGRLVESSPEETAAIGDVIRCQDCGHQSRSISGGCSQCGHGAPAPAATNVDDIHPAVREAQDSVTRARQVAADRATRIDQDRAKPAADQTVTTGGNRLHVTTYGRLHRGALDADITLDLRRTLRDPAHVPGGDLLDLTGLNPVVSDFVFRTPGASDLLTDTARQVTNLLKHKSVHVAVCCEGGKHRAAAMGQAQADAINLNRPGTADVTHLDAEKPRVINGEQAEPTPAQRQADYLFAIATHLRTHPHLTPVTPHRDGDELHISLPYRDPRTDAQALAEWALTLTDAHLTAKRYKTHIAKGAPKDVKVTAAGSIGGLDIEVWDALAAATEFGLEPGQERDITVENLITLVGAQWVQR